MLDIAMSVRPSGLFHSRSSSIFPNIQVQSFSNKILENSNFAKGRIFSEKYWYYLQAQTDMPFHYLKLA